MNAKSSTDVCKCIILINVHRGFIEQLDLYDISMIYLYPPSAAAAGGVLYCAHTQNYVYYSPN